MGYGSRALQALNSFYSGEYFNLDEGSRPETSYPDPAAIDPVCAIQCYFDSPLNVVTTTHAVNRSTHRHSHCSRCYSNAAIAATINGAKTRNSGLLGRLVRPHSPTFTVSCTQSCVLPY